MINALQTISSLLNNGKQIPGNLTLNQAIDFSYKFYKYMSSWKGRGITISHIRK